MILQIPVTGEFPAQMAINAENVSIWWRHYQPTSIRILRLHCVLPSQCIQWVAYNQSNGVAGEYSETCLQRPPL